METLLSVLNNPILHQDWVPFAVLIAGYVFVCAAWSIGTRIYKIWK
jgi:hypothetical protein